MQASHLNPIAAAESPLLRSWEQSMQVAGLSGLTPSERRESRLLIVIMYWAGTARCRSRQGGNRRHDRTALHHDLIIASQSSRQYVTATDAQAATRIIPSSNIYTHTHRPAL